jgi:hypothetical protein
MPTTPAVRASTTKRARKNEVFDKMTTVRGVGPSPSGQLMQAIAATMQAGAAGRAGLEKISSKLQSQEASRHAKDMRRK